MHQNPFCRLWAKHKKLAYGALIIGALVVFFFFTSVSFNLEADNQRTFFEFRLKFFD